MQLAVHEDTKVPLVWFVSNVDIELHCLLPNKVEDEFGWLERMHVSLYETCMNNVKNLGQFK